MSVKVLIDGIYDATAALDRFADRLSIAGEPIGKLTADLAKLQSDTNAMIDQINDHVKDVTKAREALEAYETQMGLAAKTNLEMGNSMEALSGDASAVNAELAKLGDKGRAVSTLLNTQMMPATEAAKASVDLLLGSLKNVSEAQKKLIDDSPTALDFLGNMKAEYDSGMLSLGGYSQMLHYAIDQLEQMAAKVAEYGPKTRQGFQDMADAIRAMLDQAMTAPAPVPPLQR